MNFSILRFFAIALFLTGLVTVALLGTSTTMTFVWPAYLVLGAAGVASVAVVFRKTKFVLPYSCVVAVMVAVGYFLNRAMGSPVAYFGREDGALLVAGFMVYLLFLSLLDDLRSRRALFWCLAGLLAANCLMALVQLVVGPETWWLGTRERTYEDRIGGFFNHPEHFGGFLALGLPFLLASCLFGNHGKVARIVLAILSGACLLGILLSKSLLGLLATSAGCGVLLFFAGIFCWKKLEGEIRASITWGLAATFVFVGSFIALNTSRISTLLGNKILSREDVALVPAWGASLEQFSESPWIGAGSRAFSFYSRKFLPEGAGTTFHEPEFVHNEYLQALADYGLCGLLILLGLLAVHLINGFKFVFGYTHFQTVRSSLLPRSDHLSWVAGSLGALVTIAFLSFFDFVMHVPVIAMVTAVFLGFLACPDPMSHALRPSEESFFPGGNLLFTGRGLALGCGLSLCFCSFVYHKSEWHYERAARSFEAGVVDAVQLKHLEEARRLDPQNPFARSLSGHSYVRAIDEKMPPAVRIAYLEKADQFFEAALKIYPMDIYGALAHSVVLDELNRPAEADKRLREAREWAPLYGNLMIAQGEHFLRNQDYDKAERTFNLAAGARVFPGKEAATHGLNFLAERKNRAQMASLKSSSSTVKEAEVKEIEISGEVGKLLTDSLNRLESQLDAELLSPKPVAE